MNEIDKIEVPKPKQFKALFLKNISLQKNQIGTNLCQLIAPVLMVVFVGVIQILFQHYVLDEFSPGTKIYTDPTLSNFNPQTSQFNRWNVWESGFWSKDIGNLTEFGDGSGMLGEIPQFPNNTNENTYLPYFDYKASTDKEMLKIIQNDKEYWSQRGLANFPSNPLLWACQNCSQAAINFDKFDVENHVINYTALSDGQVPMAVAPLPTLHTLINMINQAMIRYVTGNTDYTITIYTQEMPFLETSLPIDIAGIAAVILYPFAISFILPVFVQSIVKEKQERLIDMMKMFGLKMRHYWVVNYLWDFFLYCLVIIVITVTSLAFQLRIFTQTSYLLLGLLFFGWGNTLIALSFLLSTFFSKARAASIVSYMVVIASVILSYVLNYTVFQNDSIPFWMIFLFPPFAAYRALYLIGTSCTVLNCYSFGDIEVGGQMFYILILLYVDIFIYFILAFYLDQVLPTQYGVQKKPWFIFNPIIKLIKKKDNSNEEENVELIASEFSELQEKEDDDVRSIRESIYKGEIPSDTPVVIVDLKKTYKGKSKGQPAKKAVRGLNLIIEKGECFGLLGPNGAGKTSTISILTGLYTPTAGYAKICGYDIRTDISKIHTIMSVCPQFDTLWENLNCRETMLFYARLKGVKSSEEKEHVNDILFKVGLNQYGKRKVKNLSGGMKRRLSIGIALIGNPKVVFLDEPSTGLDIETKRYLWNVLLAIKEDRSIILTTHSMEEADILSDRIGIMAHGRLKCIGTQQHLKSKFGSGYTLKINYLSNFEQKAINFISNLIPSAMIVENFAGNCTFQIPKQDILISDIFEEMTLNKENYGIIDFGLNQTSIEDVFIRVAKEDELEHDMNEL